MEKLLAPQPLLKRLERGLYQKMPTPLTESARPGILQFRETGVWETPKQRVLILVELQAW